MIRLGSAILVISILGGGPFPSPAEPQAAPESSSESPADIVLRYFCVRCHGEKEQKGKFRLDRGPRDPAEPGFSAYWGNVLERLTAAEMPPPKEKQPPPAERAKLVDWVSGRLREAEAAKLSTSEKVSFHRLSREEYWHTLRDLLGVARVPSDPGGLPEDPAWRGFERLGSVMSLSASQLEKYLAAGEAALNLALPFAERPKPAKILWKWTDLRHNGSAELRKEGRLDKGRIDIAPGQNAVTSPGSYYKLQIKDEGMYECRIRASGLRPPGGDAPRVRIFASDLDRTLFEGEVEAPEEKPVTLTFRTYLPAGSHNVMLYNSIPGPSLYENYQRSGDHHAFVSNREGRAAFLLKMTDDEGKALHPFLIVDSVEWEGPALDAWPPAAQPRIVPPGARDAEHARRIVASFAERAFRRPLRAGEVERYSTVAEHALSTGIPFEAAVKAALLSVLCSKDFLFLVEGASESPRVTLDDWEVASRLSYFLSSTMPDERLCGFARAGVLRDPARRREEAGRLLADPRSERFADSFPRQWLQLRNVGKFPPDKKLYPMYGEELERSMVLETLAFFSRVLRENLGLREFLDSDWTMLNSVLASHYGIPGVVDGSMRLVRLRPEDHRGGLLTQASILSLTSDGIRHRPVHRGVWILESMFGTRPPPPPPNAGDIPVTPPKEKKVTVRAKLEAHRSNPVCASCHEKLDPLGLAFDQYDAIGRWRTHEVTQDGTGDNPAVDPSGVLPDGRAYADAAELKKLLAQDLDRFALAFLEKLSTYALRRAIRPAEKEAVRAIAAGAKEGGYRLGDLIQALVASELFVSR
jgi:mono/diheme cytochrome c family protein